MRWDEVGRRVEEKKDIYLIYLSIYYLYIFSYLYYIINHKI